MSLQVYPFNDDCQGHQPSLFDWGMVPNGKLRLEINGGTVETTLLLSRQQAERLVAVLSAYLQDTDPANEELALTGE